MNLHPLPAVMADPPIVLQPPQYACRERLAMRYETLRSTPDKN
jgi:hypothetical protein